MRERDGPISGERGPLTTAPKDAGGADAQALLDSAACGLAQTAVDGTFRRVNRLFCAWTGHAADDLVGKKRFQDFLSMGGRIFHQTHWVPLLQIQGSISEVKLDILHRDGSALPIVLNAIAHEEQGERVFEVAAFIARDRDKYERELIQSRTRLEEVAAEATRLEAEAKDRADLAEQMIGIVSHDLRNHLTSVQMATALLSRSDPTLSQERVLGRITRSTERATALIADLLDFTQARLGKGLSVSPTLIDVHATVGEMVEELTHLYSSRDLRHERAGEGPCIGDSNRLSQLVGNLVSNAMTYGEPSKPVTVTSTIDSAWYSIAVQNWGTPIPAGTQERLFQPMTRGVSGASASRSVGLGLYIVREIAKAHGGRASVTSSLAEGTTFTAVFPRANPKIL